ncbi:MAG: alpha/beta hydrolase [Chloroflexota bacterium]
MPDIRIDSTLDMHYEVDDFTDPWTNPPIAVMHHGIAKSSRFWYAWVPYLARHFRVYRVDARGFGQSSVPPPDFQYSVDSLGKDLLAFMDKLNLRKVHLLGETFGGTVSLKFAHDHPDRLHSLVFCAAPHTFAGLKQRLPQEVRTLREHGVATWARETMYGRFDRGQVPAGLIDWYQEQMSKANPRSVMGVVSQLADVDLTPLLPRVTVPVLIIGGEKSIMTPPAWLEEMRQALPHAELIIIPGAQHHVQAAFPDRCAQEAVTFMLKAGSA